MIEELCRCDEGLGLWHRHVPRKFRVLLDNEAEITVFEWDYDRNRSRIAEVLEEIPPSIAVSINWRDVAHNLMT